MSDKSTPQHFPDSMDPVTVKDLKELPSYWNDYQVFLAMPDGTHIPLLKAACRPGFLVMEPSLRHTENANMVYPKDHPLGPKDCLILGRL